MPNTHVLAAGEAMPAAEVMPILGRFSRRAMLGALASVPAIGAATAAVAVTTPPKVFPNFGSIPAAAAQADPLADAFAEYHAKMAEFMAIPIEQITTQDNEDALVAATYGPVSDRLWHATPQATSNRGVAEAIRYALDERSVIDRIAEAALVSALAFLDGERGS
ncbi:MULTISPECIES: hypothetical protein [Mesorhizobium]|uniref:hypothetical protein n=1 Tax=Mesorhizobium TaxID=68287 RepID=UPI0010A95D97|nr:MULTISPECIES: hypothetical protein [Mesorhizobium]